MYKIYTKYGMPPGYLIKLLVIMKLIVFILITTLMQVSAATFGQKLTIKEHNLSMERMFKEIRKQTGYDVVMNNTKFRSTRINADFQNTPLEEVMDFLVKGTELTYTIEDKVVMVRMRTPSFLDRTISAFASIDVRGTVLDEKGEPLAGATIKVKGTNKQTIANGRGEFFISNVDENAIIVISYLGYASKEATAAKDLGIIKLELSDAKLDEVIVNAGYYTVKDSERTGNISRITSKDIETQPVTNILATMQGRMAGVNIVQQTGAPGGGFNIKIRGQNSLRPDANSPLYVIDGVPYSSDPIGSPQTSSPYPSAVSSPLNSINPDNIESIEVLKDADATSIYGSRGANGVVLITTKKGKSGKTAFNISGAKGAGKVTRFIEMMNTQEYIAMRKQAFKNDGLGTDYGATDYDINGTWDQNRYTDWQKELLGGTAHTTDLQGSVSGGTERTQFLLSSSYHQESTVYIGDFRYKKGGVQLSINHRSEDDRFLISFSGSYNNQNNNLPAYDMSNDARNLAPNAPALYNADGSLNWENNTWQNPLRMLNAQFKSNTNDLVTSMVMSYKILTGLTLKSNFGFTKLGTIETRTAPSTVYNPFYNVTSSRSGSYLNDTDKSSWIIEPQLNYERVIAGGTLNVLLGGTFQDQTTSTMYQQASDFSSNSLIYNMAAAKFISITNNDQIAYKYQAFYGRVNYNWQQRYILNLTARRDGSSRFGPGRQFGTFGAVGGAWIFSHEKFLKDSGWLSFGKLRTSYGTTGNDQIGDYKFLNTYKTSTLTYGGAPGLLSSRLFNPDFRWEVNKKLEFGLELGFLKDRITTTASWYRNRSSNQLVGIPLPATTGFPVLDGNLPAEVQNKGLELTLGTVNFNKKDFKWSTNFNISFNRNKLLSYPNLESSTYRQQYRIGQPLNISLLLHYTGVNPQTGVYEFEDLSKDGNISFPEDNLIIADLSPKFYGGFQNQFTYKRWNLDFLFQFTKQKGNYFVAGVGQMINQPKILINSWTQPGDHGPYQIATTGYNEEALFAEYYRYYSDATIVDASFIRLKNIALSYQLPLGRQNRACKIMLQGQNLLTFTKFKGADPEYGNVDYLPPLKVISAGIQFTF